MEVILFHGVYFDLFKLDKEYENKTQEELQELLKVESNISKILKTSNSKGTKVTDEFGKIYYTDLDIGVYLLRETDNEDKRGEYDKSSEGNTRGYSMEIGKIKKIVVSYNNLNVSDNFYDKGYGGLKITKVTNKKSGLENVTFKLYRGSNLEDTGYEFTTGDNGIVYSIANETNYGVKYTTNYNIVSGVYYLFETSNPNNGYNIKFQGNTIKSDILKSAYNGKSYIEGKGAFIKSITIDTGRIYEVEIENQPYVSIDINKFIENLSGSEVTREKADAGVNKAGFQLYKGKTPISIKDINDGLDHGEFFSNESGRISIEGIPVNATYTLYETTFPKNVDPIIQPGYDPSTGYVKIATIKVDKDGSITIIDQVADGKWIKDEKGSEFLYRTNSKTEKSPGKEEKVTFRVTNRKYMKISGYVWEDISNNTKTPGTGNNKYKEKETEKDIRIEGVDVKLYKRGTSTEIESVKTNKNGEYKFEDSLVLAKDVKAGEYYIEFNYSVYSKIANTINEYKNSNTYIYTPVEPIMDKMNGSKALTQDVQPKQDKDIISNNLYKAKTGYRRKRRRNRTEDLQYIIKII